MKKESPIFFSLVSPVYNEEETLFELADRIVAAMRQSRLVREGSWEYILVDDCSSDGSTAKIGALMKKYPGIVKGARHKKRMGQGHALKTGFFLGRGSIFGTLDADLEKMPEDTPKMLEVFMAGGCDIVCAYLSKKNWISRVGNNFLKKIFGYNVQQVSTNQMIIAAPYVHRVDYVCNDQRYVVPIALALGATCIKEVETHYVPRRHGVSKYNIYKKMLIGFPEIVALKRRILRGFYKKRLTEDYRNCFDLIGQT
jgi:glycosyltransferase involved in cell wall biosynthesis